MEIWITKFSKPKILNINLIQAEGNQADHYDVEGKPSIQLKHRERVSRNGQCDILVKVTIYSFILHLLFLKWKLSSH